MVEVGGRPFVEYIVRHLENQGFHRILMLVSYLGEQIESHFGDGARYGITIQYAKEPRPLGTAGALRNTLSTLEEEFLLLYGDSYLPIDYWAVVGAFRQAGSLGLMVVYDNQAENTDVHENVTTDSAGWVTQYLKGHEAPNLRYVEAGVLCFRRSVFSALPPGKVISLEHEVFPQLIARRQLFSFVSDHRFYDIGTPRRLEEFAARQP
jgi:NDP-sugar pyrophosphorylase family protein